MSDHFLSDTDLPGTGARYFCGDEERRNTLRRLRALRAENPAEGTDLDGIHFLEVVDREMLDADGNPQPPGIGPWRQRVLLVHCFGQPPADLGPRQMTIRGGVRVTGIRAIFVRRLDDLHQNPGSPQGELPNPVRDLLLSPAYDRFPREQVLALGTDAAGDFSTYHLGLVEDRELDPTPLVGFDPRLVVVAFAFKVECPSPLDCRPPHECPPEAFEEPELDYVAKDFPTFRRLMLDRLSATVPDWQERHAADFGVALVETLAYVADQLSYYQDAAVTEGYLGTARQRISLRRHARLVDYAIDEGSAARAFVAFEVAAGADGFVLPGPIVGMEAAARRGGTPILSRLPGRQNAALPGEELSEARRRSRAEGGVVIYETLHELVLRQDHNELQFYTWSDQDCCLPAGATRATLEGHQPELAPGHLLIFEEVIGPETGEEADADPDHRHVVRLTEVVLSTDPLLARDVTEIAWHADDAPPFPLCLSATTSTREKLDRVSVARGNVVLADHGDTRAAEELDAVPAADDLGAAYFRPLLEDGPLTHAVPLPEAWLPDPAVDPADLLPEHILPVSMVLPPKRGHEPPEASPAVWLHDGESIWQPRRDLLDSGPFAEDFVAEIEDDGRARLRFGDDEHGTRPAQGTLFHATYRVGQGPSGEVGAGALRHVILDPDPGIVRVRNPLPARGGRRPESPDEIRRSAPRAFRVQERAVTAEDYARMAERHPEVVKAAATLRWTGSWTTAFVTVDRQGGRPVDPDFEDEVEAFLGRYRLVAQDVEVDGPAFVPLDLALHVCIRPDRLRSDVVRELLRRLGSGVLPDGRCAFFHPDHWTFGQKVHLSAVLAEAMAVEGVESVAAERFERWGRDPAGELDAGLLEIGRLEIARLENDPSRPDHGRLEIFAGGGR